MGLEAILMMFFVTKHLIFDWWLQTSWMASNKHRLLHPAGYVHAGLNVIGSVIAIIAYLFFLDFNHYNVLLVSITFPHLYLLLLGEFISHFVMDFVKMNVTKAQGWDMTKDPQFWYWTGFDQWVHIMYLVFMAGLIV